MLYDPTEHRIRSFVTRAGRLSTAQARAFDEQGPTFLIEYDNVQNNANHVHSVWRDFTNDFGEDLLAAHLTQHPHS